MIKKMDRYANSGILGALKKLVVNIFPIKLNACVKSFERKNIQPKTAIRKVDTIPTISLTVGNHLPCATISKLFLLELVNINGKK